MIEKDKRFLSVVEVSEIFETDPRTVRRWCRLGMLPAKRAGKRGKYMIKREDLDALDWHPEDQT